MADAKRDSNRVTVLMGVSSADGVTLVPIYVDPATGRMLVSGGTSGAPTDATYWTSSANGSLSAEVNLGALTTGLLKITVAAGVATPSTATAGTDYYNPGGTDVAVADGGTGASDAATARTNLGLAIGTNVQAYDATLASIAALGTAADKIAYTTAIDTWAETAITAFGRSLIDDAAASDGRTTLGLGTIATQAANNVAITGGSVTGITDLAIADGGTGASTAAAAFDALSPTATRGDIIYRDATSNVRLPKGSSGQVLTMGANDPAWATPSGGGNKVVWLGAESAQTASTKSANSWHPQIEFPDAAIASARWSWSTPSDFASITSVKLYWSTATTGAVFRLSDASSVAMASGETTGTESQDQLADTDITSSATANALTVTDITACINTLTISANDLLALQITRDGTHVNDTLSATAYIYGIQIIYA